MAVLDACLHVLEDANERGEEIVSAALASRLCAHVPEVAIGQAINTALELVFTEQQLCIGGVSVLGRPKVPKSRTCRPTYLSAAAARKLTDTLKGELDLRPKTCLLLLKAHDGRAWSALTYRTWASYVRQEFNLSRSSSYELLDQARVIQALRNAVGMSGIPDIPAYWSVEIKPCLDTVVAAAQARVAAHMPRNEDERNSLVREIVQQKRAELQFCRSRLTEMNTQAHPHTLQPIRGSQAELVDKARLLGAIYYLTSLPPAAKVLEAVGNGLNLTPVELRQATRWLSQFVALLLERDAKAVPQN
jgi:hypothetical protein